MQYDAMHEWNYIFHFLHFWDSPPVDAEHMSSFIFVLASNLMLGFGQIWHKYKNE